MSIEKLTKKQALAIMGFTGITTLPFSEFHEDVEKRIGHPVFTRSFGTEEFFEKVKNLYREDFIAMLSD